MAGRVVLKVAEGPLSGTDFTFDERTSCLMGRGRECGIRLPNDEAHDLISRMHCLLDINPPDVRVRDFGSLNGTDVNGQRIGRREREQSIDEARAAVWPEVELRHGDTVRLGDTVFQIEVVLPVWCCECDAEIAIEVADDFKEAEGRYICNSCRTRYSPTRVESSHDRRLLRCAHCNQDVSNEVLSNRRGEYVCRKCQSDPQILLRHLLQKADSGEPELVSISGYELVRQLGRGGMGAVYLARHSATGEEVALKVMLPRVVSDERSRERFQREIAVTQALRHEHVVTLRDSGCASGVFYFTLEYCHSGSVDLLMRRHGGTLPAELAVSLACQALDGLEYAHSADLSVPLPDGSDRTASGVVHRDLSPHNLFLSGSDSEPICKVGDFGLAKAFDTAGLSGCTMTGITAGKPSFMPRQQVIDFKYCRPEVDVWALAATLYNMLTGKVPRNYESGADPWEITLKTSATPIREHTPSLPRRLASVIDAALVDQPEIAVKSAAELREQLRRAVQ